MNPAAWQAYLKGRFFWGKWSKDGLERAIENFNKAIEAQPDYALAYTGLSDSHHLLGYLSFVPPREAYDPAKAAALKALSLDGNLGEAHLVLAKTKFFYEWDWLGFEREIKRAIELNPNLSDAHGMYGTYLSAMGRFEEGLAERHLALELDPISALNTEAVGWSYFYHKDYSKALEWYRKTLELDPLFQVAQGDITNILLVSRQDDAAMARILENKSKSKEPESAINALRTAYKESGIRAYWKTEAENLERRLKEGKTVSAFNAARVYGTLGDMDQAFKWLDKVLEERNNRVPFLKVNPLFFSLHSDPRFSAVLKQAGLQ